MAEAGRPWKSTMISTSGPTASRSAAIMRADLVDVCDRRRGIVGVGDEHDLERVVAACSTTAARARRARLRRGFRRPPSCRRGRDGCRPARWSRTLPPSSRQTGTPSDLPRMSQSAISMPLIARHADDAEPPEAVLGQDLQALLDVARIAARSAAARDPRWRRRPRGSSIPASPRPSRRGRAGRSRRGRTPSCASRR